MPFYLLKVVQLNQKIRQDTLAAASGNGIKRIFETGPAIIPLRYALKSPLHLLLATVKDDDNRKATYFLSKIFAFNEP